MKAKSLGEVEQKIMDIVWQEGVCNIKYMQSILKKRDHPLAYTTVATIVDRLHTKGLLKRSKRGNTYVFEPKYSKESYSKRLIQSYLRKFIHTFGDVAITSFAESLDTLPKNKKRYLLKLLKKQ